MKKVSSLDAPPLFSPHEAMCWKSGYNQAVDAFVDDYVPAPTFDATVKRLAEAVVLLREVERENYLSGLDIGNRIIAFLRTVDNAQEKL